MLPKNDCDILGFEDIFSIVTLTFVIEISIIMLVYTSFPLLAYHIAALKTT